MFGRALRALLRRRSPASSSLFGEGDFLTHRGLFRRLFGELTAGRFGAGTLLSPRPDAGGAPAHRGIVKTNVDGDPTYNGRKVDIHYTGYFEDGTIFDASYPNGHPFKFTLTRNEVIDGLDEGVRLMKTGEKYRFIIPPKLGYGKKQQGSIPPNTTLIFDVELISVD